MIQGRFYHPYHDKGKTFLSLIQLLTDMEQTLDSMNFPQSFTAMRYFAPPPIGSAEPTESPTQGELATFSIRVLFRQNASWQGSVIWHEKNIEQPFRSALELIFLMDSALTGEEKEKTLAG